jgi:hypothetical protein
VRQIELRVFHPNAERVSGGTIHPVQGSLDIRQTRLKAAKNVLIRSNAATDGVYGPRKAHSGFRHKYTSAFIPGATSCSWPSRKFRGYGNKHSRRVSIF